MLGSVGAIVAALLIMFLAGAGQILLLALLLHYWSYEVATMSQKPQSMF